MNRHLGEMADTRDNAEKEQDESRMSSFAKKKKRAQKVLCA